MDIAMVCNNRLSTKHVLYQHLTGCCHALSAYSSHPTFSEMRRGSVVLDDLISRISLCKNSTAAMFGGNINENTLDICADIQIVHQRNFIAQHEPIFRLSLSRNHFTTVIRV